MADVGATAAALAGEMSTPQPHAIAQVNADRQAAASLDKDGAAFDPAIHEPGPDGAGIKNMKGGWKAKRGRKAGVAQPAGRPRVVVPGAAGTPSADQTKIANARAGGTAAANLLLMVGIGIGGDEWQPRADPAIGLNEKTMLETAFGDYFESRQWEDLPPGWALLAAIGMYAMPRLQMPKTKERAKGIKNWIAGKYINWKAARAKRHFQTKEERAQTESDVERADRLSREAYARETAAVANRVRTP